MHLFDTVTASVVAVMCLIAFKTSAAVHLTLSALEECTSFHPTCFDSLAKGQWHTKIAQHQKALAVGELLRYREPVGS
jgi:hypothetical protein